MKTAIIGLGYIGKVHLGILRGIPEVSGLVLVDENTEEARRTGARWGIDDIRDSVEDVLSDPEIQIVHNCTPNHLHFELNKKALLAGKHVLSEKPLCLTSKEASKIRRIAEEHRLVTGVNFCYRYYPAVQEMAARIENGDLGDIVGLTGSFFQDWLFHETDYSWRLDPAFSGISNALGDIGSHWCDLARFVTGLGFSKLIAETSIVHPVRLKPTKGLATFSDSPDDGKAAAEPIPIELEDYATVMFRMENGAHGSFCVGQVCAGHKVDLEIKIFGSKGSVSWSHMRPERLLFGSRDSEQRIFLENPLQQDPRTAGFARLPSGHPMGYHDAVHNLFSEFYSQVRSGKAIFRGCPDFSDGEYQVGITEAAVKSAETKAWTAVGASNR